MDRHRKNMTLIVVRTDFVVVVIVLGVIFGLLAGCNIASDGAFAGRGVWKSLFNGEDLIGWRVKCKPADRGTGFWQVDEGTILADSIGHKGHDYVWLVTDEQYSDFVLRLRFQAYRDGPGNSGIQIRSRYDDQAGWLDGPQVDINPPGPWRTGMIWDETRGSSRWLYPDVPKGTWVDASMANPNLIFYFSDQGSGWNDLEITAIGTKVSVVLNGITVTDYDGTGVFNDAAHSEHGVGENGYIALQIHRSDELRIRFKDITIRDLSGAFS